VKKNIVRQYLEEPVNYGGEVMARGSVINLMRSQPMTERCNRFLTAPPERCALVKNHRGPCRRESEIPRPVVRE
jgi:hypothetical protein